MLHVISALGAARDLHRLRPGRRQFMAQWGDCKISQIAPFNVIIIITIIIVVIILILYLYQSAKHLPQSERRAQDTPVRKIMGFWRTLTKLVDCPWWELNVVIIPLMLQQGTDSLSLGCQGWQFVHTFLLLKTNKTQGLDYFFSLFNNMCIMGDSTNNSSRMSKKSELLQILKKQQQPLVISTSIMQTRPNMTSISALAILTKNTTDSYI